MLEVSDRLDLAGETQAICNIGGMTSLTHQVRLSQMVGKKVLEPGSKTRGDLGGLYSINNRLDKTFSGG